MKKSRLFLVSGPSGVGKKTLLDKIIHLPELSLCLSISMTTRPKRSNEIEGRDYYFVNQNKFLSEIEANNMLEYTKFFEHYYGTPKSFVTKTLASGKNILLEIEVVGAQQVMTQFPDCVSIFIIPPSIEELKCRLINRNTETLEKIALRLSRAEKELQLSHLYDYVVCNEHLDVATQKLVDIIKSESNN